MSERERLFARLKEIPFLEPYPSHANFILAKVRLGAKWGVHLGTQGGGVQHWRGARVRHTGLSLKPDLRILLELRGAVGGAGFEMAEPKQRRACNLFRGLRPCGYLAAASPLSLLTCPASPPPQVTNGRDAKAVKDALATQHGIMVRHYAKKELSGFIRVSVGRPEHTDKLIEALKQL